MSTAAGEDPVVRVLRQKAEMWCVYAVSKDGTPDRTAVKYWLGGVDGGGRSIGRKNSDIMLKAVSISRNHAKLRVVESTDAEQDSKVLLTDLSAYGTYVNYRIGKDPATRLQKSTDTCVNDGAFISFGAPVEWFQLKYNPVRLYLGAAEDVVRDKIKSWSKKIGYSCSREYATDVTHMVVKEIERRGDTLLSLISGTHLVTAQWVSALRQIIEEKGSQGNIPDPSKYYAPQHPDLLAGLQQNKVIMDMSRGKLFGGLSFSLNDSTTVDGVAYSEILRKAGGQTDKNLPSDLKFDEVRVKTLGIGSETKEVVVTWEEIENAIFLARIDFPFGAGHTDRRESTGHISDQEMKNVSDVETEQGGSADDETTADVLRSPGGGEKQLELPNLVEGTLEGFKRRKRKSSDGQEEGAVRNRETIEPVYAQNPCQHASRDVRRFKKSNVLFEAKFIATVDADTVHSRSKPRTGSKKKTIGSLYIHEPL